MNLTEARKAIPELQGLDDTQALDAIHQAYYPSMDKADLAKKLGYVEPKPVSDQGDFSRGFEKAMRQVPQTAGGALGLVGDIVGSDTLKNYGMGVYKAQDEKIKEISKPSDSLSQVIDDGGTGTGTFLKAGTGYVAGQALTALATGGVGGFIGSQIAKRGLQFGVKAAVEKGVEKVVAAELAAGATAEAAQAAGQAAASGIASSAMAKTGAGAALFGSNLTQEAGSIYPDALEEAAKPGDPRNGVLTGGDKFRVAASALAAAGVETAMDARMFHRISAGGRNPGESLGRAALREIPGGALKEAGTEGIQTGIERFGAQKSLTTAEAVRDYVDSMGLGALGGGLGGAAGALHAQKVPDAGPISRAANVGVDQQILQLTNDPQPLVSFPDGSVGHKQEVAAYLSQFTDPEERQIKERELMGRDPATGKRIEEKPAPEPTAADSEANSDANLKAWSSQHDPVTLQYAQALLGAPGAQGKNLMIAPHASGKGYTVVPSKWLSLDAQARAGALQKGDEGMLPGPGRDAPGGAIRVDSQGDAAPETYGEQVRTGDAQRAQQDKAASEARRRTELGTMTARGAARDTAAQPEQGNAKPDAPNGSDVQGATGQSDGGRTDNAAGTGDSGRQPNDGGSDARLLPADGAGATGPRAGADAVIMNPQGQPFVMEFAAKRKLKADKLEATHEVAKVDGGFVLQPKQATMADAVPVAEPTPPKTEPTQAKAEPTPPSEITPPIVKSEPTPPLAAAAIPEAAALDAKAIAAKQIPAMTDAELLAARDIYAPDHKRRAKIEKAIADRGIDQTKAASINDAMDEGGSLRTTMREDTKNLPMFVSTHLQEDAQGVIVGAKSAVDRIVEKGGEAYQTLYDGFANTRKALREKFGDTVTLYRADATKDERRVENKPTVFMGTEPVAKRFEANGRKTQAYQVKVDDIIAAPHFENGYHDFVVRNPSLTAPAAAVTAVPQAQTKAPITAGQRAKDNLKASDPFLSLLATHGISIEDRPDTGGETGKNRMVPGHGPIYRKAGLRLDELAQMAHDDGFLTDADIKSDTDNGGVNKLTDMIQRAVHNKELIAHPGNVERTMQATMDERELNQLADDAQHYGIDTAGMNDAQLRQAVHAKYAEETQAASAEEHDAISQDADELAALTSDDINHLAQIAANDERIENEDLAAQSATGSIRQVNENDAEATRAGRAGTETAPGPEGKTNEQGFSLAGETAAEGRARTAVEEQTTKAAAKAERTATEADRKKQDSKEVAARQDASAENFQLGQSAEQSLTGQKDMLAPAAEPEKSIAEIRLQEVRKEIAEFPKSAKSDFSKAKLDELRIRERALAKEVGSQPELAPQGTGPAAAPASTGLSKRIAPVDNIDSMRSALQEGHIASLPNGLQVSLSQGKYGWNYNTQDTENDPGNWQAGARALVPGGVTTQSKDSAIDNAVRKLKDQFEQTKEAPASAKTETAQPGDDIPRAFWKKVTVQHDVWITDENRYENVPISADKAIASVREDLTHLRSLLACMKG